MIAQETRDIYAPIANRLGMSKVKNELEELSFRYLEPQAYEALRAQGRRQTPRGGRADRGAQEARLPPSSAKRRFPSSRSTAGSNVSTASARNSSGRRSISIRSHDFLALRIVTESVKDCYGVARHHSSDVVAGAGTHQGLHRHAASERLSVVAHVGHQRARDPVRSADPNDGDAPNGGRGHRRALEDTRKAGSAIRATSGISSGCASCSKISRTCATRRNSSRNLKIELYPEEVYAFTPKGAGQGVPARSDANRLRLLDSHGRRSSVRRRARERQDGASAHAAQERRHCRDHHADRSQAQSRLAERRRHLPRALQDQNTSFGWRRKRVRSESDESCSRKRRDATT